MKKAIILAIAATAAGMLPAAVASVRQAGSGLRPVTNSGTGVMPAGAQEAMPRTSATIAKNSMQGAGITPFMLGIVPPAQIPAEDYDVGGVRLNLVCGRCVNFDGLDFGVVGIAENHANGWLFNVVSVAYGDGVGLHTGGVNWIGGDFQGLQFGIANWADSGDVFQIGIYNGVRDAQGFQVGVINTAETMQGLQIGIVNVIKNSDVPFFPIINGWF